MVELATRTQRRGGITLVEAAVTNDGTTPRRVRLASELDGPVWPPRRRGVPAEGWTDGAVTVHLSPGERVGLGFASPAEPVDPPVTVAESARAPPDDGIASSPTDVVRALGDPAPPRDVALAGCGRPSRTGVAGGSRRATPAAEDSTTDHDGTAPDQAGEATPVAPDSTSGGVGDPAPSDAPAAGDRGSTGRPPGPPAVAAWLAALERRLEATGPDPPAAGEDGAAAGPDGADFEPWVTDADPLGPDGIEPGQLRAVATRARELAARAEGRDPP